MTKAEFSTFSGPLARVFAVLEQAAELAERWDGMRAEDRALGVETPAPPGPDELGGAGGGEDPLPDRNSRQDVPLV
jgi:hypothetical protein